MEHFLTHEVNIAEGMGFAQFGPEHLTWIGLMVLLELLIVIRYKKADERRRILIRRIIAVSFVVLEITKLLLAYRDGAPLSHYLPLEVCSFAAYAIIFDAIFPKNRTFTEMILLLFVPAAVMSHLFPTTNDLPPINVFVIHQFVFHALIIGYAMARFVSGEIPVRYRAVWTSCGIMCIIAAIIYGFDTLFDRNFMFLRFHENNPMLLLIWNTAGNGRFYLPGLVIFVLFVLHIFYFIFKGLEKVLVR